MPNNFTKGYNMKSETEKIFEEIDAFSDSDIEEYRLEKLVKKNLEEELKTLFEIFPDVNVDDIPDEVFEKSNNGKGLAAEYALFYLKEEKKKGEQKEKEEENLKAAPPDVKNATEDAYFTPEDVRGMTEAEIRKNYHTIMKSMEKWN